VRPDTAGVADLLERMAISDLLDAYAHAVDHRDWDALRGLFTADAVLDYTSAGGPRGQRDEVLGWLRQTLPAVRLTQHLISNKRIAVDADRATAGSEMLNPLLVDGPDRPQLVLLGGRYDDRLRRGEGGWRIAERVHTVAWTAGPFPAEIAP
jgi:3-phenylpropionate/cinnamic acid dioxygenase small subunit